MTVPCALHLAGILDAVDFYIVAIGSCCLRQNPRPRQLCCHSVSRVGGTAFVFAQDV